MSGTWTIAKRDFRSYFSGPAFYFVGAIFMGFLSYTYVMVLSQFADNSVRYMMQMQGRGGGLNLHNEVFVHHISNVNLILLFMAPFLTVRLFTEEKKMRSFDLLLTSPVSATGIVLGKFLAGAGASLVLILLSFIYPLATLIFTPIQWGPLFSAYAGLILLSFAYVSIGIFCSSLTDSMIVAGFTAFILSLLLWFIAWSAATVQDPTMQTILQHFSVSQHFSQFVRGSLELKSFIFYFSVIFMYGFLTQRVVESHRWR